MSEKPGENISKFYSALGNPIRRQIVQLLVEKSLARRLGGIDGQGIQYNPHYDRKRTG